MFERRVNGQNFGVPPPTGSPLHPPPSQIVQDFNLVALSFALYWGAYELNELLDPHAWYMQGVSLIFLPAGIKLVMIMVAGWRGALGCGLALLWLAARFWTGQPWSVLAAYAALSVVLTYGVVSWLLRRRALGATLEGLRFWDIVSIDLVNTLLHGVVINLFWWSLGQRGADALWSAALAMALGDFLGSGAILLLVLGSAHFLVPATR